MKVGVLTGDPEAEDYMIKYSGRPWLDKNRRLDDAVVRYLKYKKYDVSNITPEQISDDTFQQYDVIFYPFLDPLASRLISESLYKKLTNLLKKYEHKVWPPYQYGSMISDKCAYYAFLKKKKLPVAPFQCFGPGDTIKYRKSKYGTVVKPVLGTSSIGMNIFNRGKENKAASYGKKLLNKYPKVVFQNLLPYLANGRSPEIKMYFIGDAFAYGWITYGPKDIYVPFASKSKTAPYRLTISERTEILNLCKKVLTAIKPVAKILLTTRLDVYWNIDKNKWYVNEIEYAPAFIVGKMKHSHQYMVDKKLGQQFIKVIKAFRKNSSIVK